MKIERLISIIYMLLNHDMVTASALADKYGVSQRTIYRDIETICSAGIPVVSYQGVKGGFGIVEGYKMEKSLLGSYDIQSLITVLNSMSTVFEDEKASETLQKLQALQPKKNDPILSLDISSWQTFNEYLRTLRKAIADCKVVRIEYINARDERSKRQLEPLNLIYKFDTWYVYAYCRSRQDYREFKLSRIIDLKLSTQHFRPHEQSLQQNKEIDIPSKKLNQAVLCFRGSLAKAMDLFHYEEISFQDDGSLIVTLQYDQLSEIRWLKPLILSFGEKVEVHKPQELKSSIKSTLEKMIKNFS